MDRCRLACSATSPVAARWAAAREVGRADAVRSHGLIVESTHLLLGPSTSLADYQARLQQSGLATVAALTAQAGGQFLLQVHGMPRWISKSQVVSTPPGCEDEWPTYQTVAPDPAKWSDWEGAIAATVTHFNVTHGLTNVWYQFWEEPDGPCFWTDTEANFLETWRHFVAGARSADPAARVGGPEPAGGPDSIKPGTSWAIMQSFIEFSAAQGIQPDFISYHLFGTAPEQNRRANRRVRDLLSANGFGPLSQPHVEFIGEIDEAGKAEFLGNARALLFPIDWPEPFGLVLIEAVSCGTPCIAWRAGSVPELVDDGVTGFVVDSIEAAVDAVHRVSTLDRARVRARFEQRSRRSAWRVTISKSTARSPRARAGRVAA